MISFVNPGTVPNMFAGLTNRQILKIVKITQTEYQQWQNEYLFDALKNQRYGQSFCNRFDITDNILFYERDANWADNYIKQNYLSNDSSSDTTC